MKRHGSWRPAFGVIGLLLCLTCVSPISAATQSGRVDSEESPVDVEAKPVSALAKAQKELTQRLLDVEQAKESESAAEKEIEEANGKLLAATTADDADAKEEAEAELKSATDKLKQAKSDHASAQQLADQAQERLQLLQKEEDLNQPKGTKAEENGTVPFEETFKKFSQASQSRKEADIAKQLATTLRKQVESLQARLKQVRRDSDEINQRLTIHGGMSEAAKANL